MSSIHAGKCLCGETQFQIIGEAVRFLYCHCSRCRKSTGSAHASNLFIEADGVQWTSGEANLRTYKVPEAERFARTFCNNCGSLLPAYVAARGMVVVPAGTLETEPPIKPQARIFQQSRAQWSIEDQNLVCFDEYPE